MHVPSLGKTTNVVSTLASSIASSIIVKAIQLGETFFFSSRSIYLCFPTKIYGIFNSRVLSSSYGKQPRTMAIIFYIVFVYLCSLPERYSVLGTKILIIDKLLLANYEVKGMTKANGTPKSTTRFLLI